MTPQLRAAFDEYRQSRANELYEIAALLEGHGITSDAGPIRMAANQCRAAVRTADPTQPDAGRAYWGYDVTDFRIGLEPQRHCRPRRASMDSVSAFLSVTVQEYVPTDIASVGDSYDLLRRLDTDFYFDAELDVQGEIQPLRAAWHVDTHLHMGTPSHSVHPRFHFQVGGERFDALDDMIRGVFVPETPRMPCAPMDALLALDFILSHYCGTTWELLRDLEPQRYGRLRQAPFLRYWYPYFRTLADGIAALERTPDGGAANALVPNIYSA